MLNIKNEIKELSIKIKSLKLEFKDLQRKKQFSYRISVKLIELQNQYRYSNIAYTLIKKTKREDLINRLGHDLLDLILLLKIETNYNKNKLEQYGYNFLYNKEENIRSTIKYDLLKKELERIYNGK